jgi:hypothetical protein
MSASNAVAGGNTQHPKTCIDQKPKNCPSRQAKERKASVKTSARSAGTEGIGSGEHKRRRSASGKMLEDGKLQEPPVFGCDSPARPGSFSLPR